MGVITGVVVGIIGLVLMFITMLIPNKYIPFCWIPNLNCDKAKAYWVIVVTAILVGFIPVLL